MSDWLQSNSGNQSSEDAPGLEEPADARYRSGPEMRDLTSISSVTEEASGLDHH